LLAEDTMINQKLITRVLEKAGLDVTVVENGQLAVDATLEAEERGELYDAVVLDMHMPVLDGYGAARVLRDRFADLPVIALTANVMAEDRNRCFEAGCSGFATKPIQQEKLLDTLRDAILSGKK
ncbi:MAG: response regulator, partial [Planctomycetota bacterium]